MGLLVDRARKSSLLSVFVNIIIIYAVEFGSNSILNSYIRFQAYSIKVNASYKIEFVIKNIE